MSDVKLTVITAVVNAVKTDRAEKLERCVKSVAALRTQHEHLIIDGASTDGTVELLQNLIKKYSGLEFISEPDTGLYNALNKGIRLARGRWIYVLGSDDYLCVPANLDELFTCGVDVPTEMIISPVKMADGVQEVTPRYIRRMFYCMAYCHQGVLMRRQLLVRLGGFNEIYNLAADYDICLRANFLNVGYEIVRKPFAYFEKGGASSDLSTYRKECSISLASVIGLTDIERNLLFYERQLPGAKIVNLVFHPNSIIRIAARHMLKRRIAKLFGVLDSHGNPKKIFRQFWKIHAR